MLDSRSADLEPCAPDSLLLLCQTLRASGSGRITLRGKSMHPTLQDGWVLQVRAVPAESLRVGDIAAFIHGPILTIHRLVWRKRTGGQERLVFQGDNNPAREEVSPEAVIGRVETARMEGADGASGLPFAVGNDARAFFYRSIHRAHETLAARFPGARVPEAGEPPTAIYRVLRRLFRVLEPIFSPHPRR